MAKPLCTVAICTRNRAEFLQTCLEGLHASMGSNPIPVLVVDNGSSDRTAEVLSTYRDRVRIVIEPRVGLSHARNRALAECDTDYMVFLDDDGIPSTSWASAVREVVADHTPDVFGGPFVPFYKAPKKAWFADHFGSAHTELRGGPQPFGTCFSGGNMGWRCDLLKSFGGFDPALGITGGRLRLGEETALQVAIWQADPQAKFVFSAQMYMTHYVSPQKMTLRYIFQRNFTYGWQLVEINPVDQMLGRTSLALARDARFGLPLFARRLVRDRRRYPYWKSFAAAYISLHAIALGVIVRRVSAAAGFVRKSQA